MSDDDSDDFEEFWKDVRKRPPYAVIDNRSSRVKDQLLAACENAVAKTQVEHLKPLLDISTVRQAVSLGIRFFMTEWYEGIRNQNLSGLVEIVLEDQSMTPEELKGFVRALPKSFLEKVTQSAFGSATGVHALLAFEWHYRQGKIQDYTLTKDPEGRTEVHLVIHDKALDFRVDDYFDLPEELAPQGAPEQ